MQKISYARYRFPPVIIQHAVWLYFRFPLSYRDVEDLLAERGIDVSYETVRRWALKFGQAYAQRLRIVRSGADTCVVLLARFCLSMRSCYHAVLHHSSNVLSRESGVSE